MISIVVPCYNESENIRELCERCFYLIFNKSKTDNTNELLIMEDESEGTIKTCEIIEELVEEGYNIQIYVRKKESGRGGLSCAVLDGIRKANNELVVVMDGDLQHEPESIPRLTYPVITNQYDMSIGSRNMDVYQFDTSVLSILRIMMSWIATLLSWGLTSSTDPMSGFFCVRKSKVLDNMDKLNTLGFKIGLEIMVVCGCRVVDIPITFCKRVNGESKLGIREVCLYLYQLYMLYKLKLTEMW